MSNVTHPARGCGRDHRAHHHLRGRLVWRRPPRHPSGKLHRRMQEDRGETPVVTDDVEPPSSLAQRTAEIISAYVSNNHIAPSELGALIRAVAGQLSKVG